MDLYETIRKRRSYRTYEKKMPEKEKIMKILDAARLAPTWANKQGVHYIVVQEPKNVKSLWEAIGQKKKFIEAPMFIVGIIAEKGSGTNSSGLKYFTVDIGICFEHLILAATAEGLATCWIGWFDEEKIKELLKIPEKYRVVGITPLGYTSEIQGEVDNRKPLERMVHYEIF